jgi:hypothetical protein
MVNPKQKGKKGEDEACEWLSKYLYHNKRFLERNQNQVFIGADIVTYPFIFEVKRRETLALDAWWIQIHRVHDKLKNLNKMYIPVVMFRQNRKEWEFLISASSIGCTGGYVRLNNSRFIEWAGRYVESG